MIRTYSPFELTQDFFFMAKPLVKNCPDPIDYIRRYEDRLDRLGRKHRRRNLVVAQGLDFTSNDYLALVSSPRLQAYVREGLDKGIPIGAGGSRLLRGNHKEHEALESEAATFFGSEQMLYFHSGYMANLAALSTLPERGDLIIYDELVHASLHAGIAASRAQSICVAHNDPQAFEAAIKTWRQGGGRGYPWIIVESLYSMDGDQAPLSDLIILADRYHGFLYIDEAHATGVYGLSGRGLAEKLKGRDNVLVLHTCGKALGVAGGLLGAAKALCDTLVNLAPSFIYATAPSPLQAWTVRSALKLLIEEPERQTQLQHLIRFANQTFQDKLQIKPSGSQILPVILGDSKICMKMAKTMQDLGFDLRAIRPPTVPAGTSRLRISITLNLTATNIADMLDNLAGVLEKEGLSLK